MNSTSLESNQNTSRYQNIAKTIPNQVIHIQKTNPNPLIFQNPNWVKEQITKKKKKKKKKIGEKKKKKKKKKKKP